MTIPEDKLLFSPFSSLISPTFWGKFDEVKVEILQLNEDPVPISGYYAPHDMLDVNPILSVDNTSFDIHSKPHFGAIKARGILKTTLSLEQFKGLDYNHVMKTYGQTLLSDLFSDEGLERISENPTVLASFFILTYPDLKKYKFLFWFGFPAIILPSFESCLCGPIIGAENSFTNYHDTLHKKLHESTQVTDKGFFLVIRDEEAKGTLKPLTDIKSLSSLSSLSHVWFGFLDTSSINGTPSWVLRNYLAFIKLVLKLPGDAKVNIFSFRPGRSSNTKDKSCTFGIKFKKCNDNVSDSLETAKFVGWERNDKGAFGPKHIDVQATMDPAKLAENSVDFNLKLMKWRLFPEFDLKMMHKTKCLIVGAGTLGCNVARCLMGWGIRHITFADNGNVSYSNPVRQSLYSFEDCTTHGGKGKAEAAANALRKIYPGIKAHGEKLMVPMPGHPISAGTKDQVKADYDNLVKLVEECDVIFLLMDTRESRWLPTVLGAKYEKIVINAALGFDSYLVMRHGMLDTSSKKRTLGCYYCTDVVAPGDSTKDRTLDQQCTVTRPGVSMIAAALAVELMAAVLHHPLRAMASGNTRDDTSSPLGFVPHSIRGFLSSGEQISPSFQAYDKCTGCSEKVLEELDKRGFEFVADVLNNSSDYLEKLTGLDKLKEMDDISEGIIELSDEEEFN